LALNLEATMTPTMPRWYERANEASFKPAEGGYVFQAPSPWIFARPSYYLVSDAKKAEISARLGRWRLLLLMVGPAILCLMLPVILFPSTIGRLFLPLYQQLGTGLFAPFLFTVLMLLMAPLIAVPQIYLARALRPLLADAPPTEERIKLAEQLPRVAGAMSTKLLVIGLVSALAMMAASGLLLLDAFLEGRLAGSALFSSSIFAIMGGLLTFYFIYLLNLKAKLKQDSP
jgi:hypothetical protein